MLRDCFLTMVDKAKTAGFSEREIAGEFGTTTVGLRQKISEHHRTNRYILRAKALEMKMEGKSVAEIATALDKQESSVRLLLDKEANDKFEADREAYLRGEKPKKISREEVIESGKIARKAEEAEQE